MSIVYRSETVTVSWDQRGFVELVVNENHRLTFEEIAEMTRLLKTSGHTRVRTLISRINDYQYPEDHILHNLSKEGVATERVAFFAPSLQGQIYSSVVKLTALRDIPTRIFSNREEALTWLLGEEPAEPSK